MNNSITINPEMGMYDSGNGQTVKAYRFVDMSNLCPKAPRLLVKYAEVMRGRIAQLCHWYEADKDFGSTLHYHISLMTADELAKDEVFVRTAIVVGADPLALAQEIYKCQ